MWELARITGLRRASTMPRRYTSDELATFERSMEITLPDSYKHYVTEVGAGEFVGIKVSLMEEWCQPYDTDELPRDFLARPFPHTSAWNKTELLDPALGWRAPYFDRLLFCGSMRIRNLGCESYDLLVVSGTERGTVWRDARAGSQEGIFPLTTRGASRLTIDEYLA
jgi:hypothetical protein